MQTRSFKGPFIDRNGDLAGSSWITYGASVSHVDDDDTTGYAAVSPQGGEAVAHILSNDDGTIPALANIRYIDVVYRLGLDALTVDGPLPVVPYIHYDGSGPVFQDQIIIPFVAAFADYTVRFPRDPEGFPWTRATMFRKHDKLLLIGLRSSPVELTAATVLWSECRVVTTFDLPVPLLATSPASMISDTTAVLNGRLNPRGATSAYPLTYWFEYGKTVAYGSQTVPVANVTGDAVYAVSAPIIDLEVDVGYHFRLVASTADGTFYGDDLFFTTDPGATGRWRLDEYKRLATGEWLPGDRTRLTSVGFDRPSPANDDADCPFLEYVERI